MKNFGVGLLGMIAIAWALSGVGTLIYLLTGLIGEFPFEWNWFTTTGTIFWCTGGVAIFILLTYMLGEWMREQ